MHAVQPTVSGGDVDEQQSIAEAAEGDAVAVDDVQVDFVQVPAAFPDGFAGGRLSDGGEVAEGRWEGATGNERGVGRGGGDVLLILKAAAAKDPMEVEGFKGGSVFARRGGGTGRNVGERFQVGVKGGNQTFGEWNLR